MGSEIMLEYKYSNMLAVLSITFFYSSGLPVLYPVAALYFITTYWVDKCILLKCNKLPPKYDDFIAQNVLFWFEVILFFHLAGFLMMYGISPILDKDLFGTIKESQLEDFGLNDGIY